ncbi:Protein of unknown function [Pyronema omphalodes CBS 100304]|uniref:Uncharacterized protein n=1 Tax=Pyronema omphalodes (strain CBS 100304) TaxID=1076935 RepID=U4L5V8_PYROM|nr:Protein of unknown function [Pyronema omphalodes CBS 100304]
MTSPHRGGSALRSIPWTTRYLLASGIGNRQRV